MTHHLTFFCFLFACAVACSPSADEPESFMKDMSSAALDMPADSEDAAPEQDAFMSQDSSNGEDASTGEDMIAIPEEVMLTWPLDAGRHVLDVEHGGLTREVRVVVPEQQVQGVLLLLHGSGQTAESFSQKRAELISMANKQSLLVLVPLATVQGTKPSWNYAMLEGARDIDFLRALVTETRRLELPGPRYVAGFSNGGRMTHTLLSLYPDMFTAGGVVASNLGVRDTPEGIDRVVPEATGAVPVWMANGSMDPSVPFEGGPSESGDVASVQEAIDKWVTANQCQGDGERTDFDPMGAGYTLTWRDCMGGTQVIMNAYRSNAHAWPELGDVPGWDANKELMTFFSGFVPR